MLRALHRRRGAIAGVSVWRVDIAAVPGARPQHAWELEQIAAGGAVARAEPRAARVNAANWVRLAARQRRRDASRRTCLAKLRLGLRGRSRSFRPQRRNFTCCWLWPNKLLHKLSFWIAPSPQERWGRLRCHFSMRTSTCGKQRKCPKIKHLVIVHRRFTTFCG